MSENCSNRDTAGTVWRDFWRNVGQEPQNEQETGNAASLPGTKLAPAVPKDRRGKFPPHPPAPGSGPAVQQLPDSPAGVVTDVERPIGPDRQPRRAVAGPRGLLLWPGESIGEDLVVSRGLAGRERLEDDVEPRLRLRRTVPGSVEGDECAAAILLRELRPAVKHQVVRR